LTAAYLHALPHASRCRFVPVLWTVLAATVYGITMELCQKLFTTSRSMDPLDALANAAGALTCALLLYAWSKRRAKRSPSPDSAAQ
jgi:VanZ family protein